MLDDSLAFSVAESLPAAAVVETINCGKTMKQPALLPGGNLASVGRDDDTAFQSAELPLDPLAIPIAVTAAPSREGGIGL
ncbi:hypothetical protein B0I00_0564 [Novosphingobium kunmingense]|uniref:Uncharacterized protein n=1 Tax=Novosphingobium kunmingense TaxID=1211806 RepID=A0A2N0I2G5_9SPHN|nr:hypothetical protein [Novosphingobium kunmingense]PKB25367.1 hypothetical protein B0I00_0564 [Novosphingobium kunmingense]